MKTIKIDKHAHELLNHLSAQTGKDESTILALMVASGAAGYFNLETIIPQRMTTDVDKVLAIVQQLPDDDHPMPVNVALPAELTVGPSKKGPYAPLSW